MFKELFEVRDSELDIGGIVNNANYLHYLEHARHKYLQTFGLSFVEYYKQGYNFVIVSYQLNYKHPLQSHDQFFVTCELRPHRSPLKINFQQEIRLIKNNQLILNSDCVVACINHQAKTYTEKFAIPAAVTKILKNEIARENKTA